MRENVEHCASAAAVSRSMSVFVQLCAACLSTHSRHKFACLSLSLSLFIGKRQQQGRQIMDDEHDKALARHFFSLCHYIYNASTAALCTSALGEHSSRCYGKLSVYTGM